ncbi:hypothetical protein KJZ99_10405 [bacterium]|nr:hypothetical protein [bacterium]
MKADSLRMSMLALFLMAGISWAEQSSTLEIVRGPNFGIEVKGPVHIARPLDGSEDLSRVPVVELARSSSRTLDDPIGQTYLAGTTYYEIQHNSTSGRIIGVDNAGNVHVVWTNGDISFVTRNVYYNVKSPAANSFVYPGGVQANTAQRAGFVSLAVERNGWGFPAFHERVISDPNQHSVAAIDFLPGAGAFTNSAPDWLYNNAGSLNILWPKIAIGRDSVLHMVSTESSSSYPYPFYYSRGAPIWLEGTGLEIDWQTVDIVNGQPVEFRIMDTLTTVSANIAASPVSGRVVIAWNGPHPVSPNSALDANQNDLYIMVSEDNGLNWGEPINVTNFCGPDIVCQTGNWSACNGDTLRVWADNTILLDEDDNIHVAFTVVGYRYWTEFGQPMPTTTDPHSGIWYWNSGTNSFSPIALAFDNATVPGAGISAGVQHRAVCKPSLAIDDDTGVLYCSYWRAMPNQWSGNLIAMGDLYISRSGDGGSAWSVGTNVTRTDGGQFAPAPTSLSERDPGLAERVTVQGGVSYLHLFYEMDYDAGIAIQGEGSATLNELLYQPVPVDSIFAMPTVPWSPLHVEPVIGACCYVNSQEQAVCEQISMCDCKALGGDFHGPGSTVCTPANDQCPGTTITSLPFTASGTNCCAAIDWEDCGIPAKDVFFNFTPECATTARISLCNSPESWDSHVSIYRASEGGGCTDDFRMGCLDNGCLDPNHVDQLFTFSAGETYFLVLSGYFPDQCGRYVLDVTVDPNSTYPSYPQPDTLSNDDGQIVAYYVSEHWSRVRFTAPDDFDLHTAYVYTGFGSGGCAEECSLYVYDAPPAPAGEVANTRAYVAPSTGWSDLKWVDGLFNNVVSIGAGNDFWIAVGPTTAGQSWRTLLTSGESGRSEVSFNGLHGDYNGTQFYELVVRAGGVLGLGTPDSLVVKTAGNVADIELAWSAAAGADYYRIYRGTDENLTPVPANLIGTSVSTSYLDTGILQQPVTQYYYIVTAARQVTLTSSTRDTQVERREFVDRANEPFRPMQLKQP